MTEKMREDVYFFLGAYQAATVADTGRFAIGNYTDQHQLCGIMFRAVSSYRCTTRSAHRWPVAQQSVFTEQSYFLMNFSTPVWTEYMINFVEIKSDFDSTFCLVDD